uniref:Homolog of Odr-2 (Two) n=1 Tax=Ascaris lumbricoides TaxID=6252 RepID=A0A0M3HWK2_ASCLU
MWSEILAAMFCCIVWPPFDEVAADFALSESELMAVNTSLLNYLNFFAGTVPRRFDCFSCMSLSYQESWEHLQSIYTAPKVFTNRCNDPYLTKNIPTVQCGSVCVSLLEPDVEAGVFIGYKYIRGCLDRVLRNGFNETALRTHRFHQVDQCRSLPRAQLYNPSRNQLHPIFGDVQLCSCYGDRCNGASIATRRARSSILLIIFCAICAFINAHTTSRFELR